MATDDFTIRDATVNDLERINEIYNWTIVDNHVSFDTEPFDLDRRRQWWDARAEELTFLVAESAGQVVGLTYSTWYRPKLGYRSSMETTIVLDQLVLGRGLGTQLLAAMMERLRKNGTHLAVAIIALPNDGSIALHHKLGYNTVGVLHGVGFKDGVYHDTMLLECNLESDR